MATRILVVDDEPQIERLVQQRLRKTVREGVLELGFALNGIDALEMLQADSSFDIVLTDINMPKMDGLTLLAKIQESYPQIKTVIVSAYGDMANIRKAMNLGAFDFITKPIDFVDLEKTIFKTIAEIEVLKKLEAVEGLERENQHLIEIDRLKSQFFTNISHEFRTPLTIISGMAEQIYTQPEKWLNKGVSMIQRNTNYLLTMVNQILELRKIESNKVGLDLQLVDISLLVANLVESHMPYIEMKDLKLEFQRPSEAIWADMDIEKFLTIGRNLLSNAIKYTQTGGLIQLNLSQENSNLILGVIDNGIGIPNDQITEVFNRFFRADSTAANEDLGTGIGLALVKELTTLLGGEIRVESTLGEGTSFLLKLPHTQTKKVAESTISHQNYLSNEIPGMTTTFSPPVKTSDNVDLNKILLIDDNPEILTYISFCLEGIYEIHYAHDGQEGIEKAIDLVPDIIVSDVMMPKKNGFEVCEILKADVKTSHIPIVLLTAKADLESKLEGLSKGADAYLPKPFNKRELLLRLEKLIELRNTLRRRYETLEHVAVEEATQSEDQFIIDLKQIVYDEMQNENFGIYELCRAIGMSRTQLHRKIKALTGVSTSIFIRRIRLIEAKKLLEDKSKNISEIAYEVGFNDPKYFSTSFAKEFGISPKQFRS